MTEQELQEKLTNYGDFILNREESEQDSEEQNDLRDVIIYISFRIDCLLKRMRAYSGMLSAVSDSIMNGDNDAADYSTAIEYLSDEIFIFLSDLDTLSRETDEKRKNL